MESAAEDSAKGVLPLAPCGRCLGWGWGVMKGTQLEITSVPLSSGVPGQSLSMTPNVLILYKVQGQDIFAVKTLSPLGGFSSLTDISGCCNSDLQP